MLVEIIVPTKVLLDLADLLDELLTTPFVLEEAGGVCDLLNCFRAHKEDAECHLAEFVRRRGRDEELDDGLAPTLRPSRLLFIQTIEEFLARVLYPCNLVCSSSLNDLCGDESITERVNAHANSPIHVTNTRNRRARFILINYSTFKSFVKY